MLDRSKGVQPMEDTLNTAIQSVGRSMYTCIRLAWPRFFWSKGHDAEPAHCGSCLVQSRDSTSASADEEIFAGRAETRELAVRQHLGRGNVVEGG